MFKQIIASQNSKKIQERFDRNTKVVFSRTNCLDCAKCCRNHSPIIASDEILKLATVLDISASNLFEKYVEMDEDGDFVFRTIPCPMLNLEDNRCRIYDHRPQSCRSYPHTNEKNIQSHLDILEKNIEICPAAKEILDNVLKEIKA